MNHAASRARARSIARDLRARVGVIGLLVSCAIAPLMADSARAADAARPSVRSTPLSSTSARRLVASGVPATPLRHALNAFECARSRGQVDGSTLTLIDYSRPSAQRRMWVIDLERGRVRFHEYVTHGRNSGHARSIRFSNEMGSKQSSLGLFRTAETYVGRHGYSLRLDGLEAGVNDRARERAIVIHGADYATGTVARQFGRLGRSWGCPAVDPAIHRALIDGVRGGTAVFAYYPDADWLADSSYQSCEPETETTTASR
jgi:L,D-transpeptidase catalytic domain